MFATTKNAIRIANKQKRKSKRLKRNTKIKVGSKKKLSLTFIFDFY